MTPPCNLKTLRFTNSRASCKIALKEKPWAVRSNNHLNSEKNPFFLGLAKGCPVTFFAINFAGFFIAVDPPLPYPGTTAFFTDLFACDCIFFNGERGFFIFTLTPPLLDFKILPYLVKYPVLG